MGVPSWSWVRWNATFRRRQGCGGQAGRVSRATSKTNWTEIGSHHLMPMCWATIVSTDLLRPTAFSVPPRGRCGDRPSITG